MSKLNNIIKIKDMEFEIQWRRNYFDMTIDFIIIFHDGSTIYGDIQDPGHSSMVILKIQEIILSYLNESKILTNTKMMNDNKDDLAVNEYLNLYL